MGMQWPMIEIIEKLGQTAIVSQVIVEESALGLKDKELDSPESIQTTESAPTLETATVSAANTGIAETKKQLQFETVHTIKEQPTDVAKEPTSSVAVELPSNTVINQCDVVGIRLTPKVLESVGVHEKEDITPSVTSAKDINMASAETTKSQGNSELGVKLAFGKDITSESVLDVSEEIPTGISQPKSTSKISNTVNEVNKTLEPSLAQLPDQEQNYKERTNASLIITKEADKTANKISKKLPKKLSDEKDTSKEETSILETNTISIEAVKNVPEKNELKIETTPTKNVPKMTMTESEVEKTETLSESCLPQPSTAKLPTLKEPEKDEQVMKSMKKFVTKNPGKKENIQSNEKEDIRTEPKTDSVQTTKKSTEKRDIDVTVSSKSTSIREVNEPEDELPIETSVQSTKRPEDISTGSLESEENPLKTVQFNVKSKKTSLPSNTVHLDQEVPSKNKTGASQKKKKKKKKKS